MNGADMDILVIGGGGREHAIIKKLKQSPLCGKIYALPGNGGIAEDAVCVPIAATDIAGIKAFASETHVDFAAVIPDDPLAMGLTDELRAMGIPCFGPSKAAAIIESSKAFSKELMKRYGIPTAPFETFSDYDEAVKHLENHSLPVVIKADGLALGKGVIIANTLDEAKAAVKNMMLDGAFGHSGDRVVIEDFLVGPEISLLVFTDGKSAALMPASMDHKRIGDGDTGKNTGGMGAVAPNPYFTDEVRAETTENIIIPTLEAMKKEGRTFKGCLYFGLMLTKNGVKVIEYNCRFGDPETQAVLPLMESDLLETMLAVEEERLCKAEVRFSDKFSCCLVLASGGYPEKYEKGKEIIFDNFPGNIEVFHAGTKQENGKMLTNGGRVLGLNAVRDTLREAVTACYEAAEHVSFENKYMRNDIGKLALEAID